MTSKHFGKDVVWEQPGQGAVVSDAPTDLIGVRALSRIYPGLGERWIRRVFDERRVRVYRAGGRVLVSAEAFAQYLVRDSGVASVFSKFDLPELWYSPEWGVVEKIESKAVVYQYWDDVQQCWVSASSLPVGSVRLGPV